MNTEGLKVLMISSDRLLFEEGSAVSGRLREYGDLVGELHIVVLALSSLGLSPKKLGENVWLYPTNSFSKFFYIHDAATLGKKIILEKKFVRGKSVITAQDPFECGSAALKVKNKWRLPLEIQLHTDPFSPYFTGFLNSIRKSMASKVLARADSIRVVSESLKANISRYTQAPITVLPIYVDKEKIESQRISFDIHAKYPWHFILLTVSRLAPEKNLILALQTLSLVRQKFPETGLIIVGSGPAEGMLRSLVKKMNLEGAVEFAGWQNDLASFYRTSNVFLQTSLFEGYGLSLVEAGLSGLPVVTTPVGIAQEFEHGKDAYIYPPERADQFASGVVDLLENNFKRENLKINLKRTLDSKLISKADYLSKLKVGWEACSLKVK
jgi:glycosyltransferase involved in cell wall biosynthesis